MNLLTCEKPIHHDGQSISDPSQHPCPTFQLSLPEEAVLDTRNPHPSLFSRSIQVFIGVKAILRKVPSKKPIL